MQAIKAPPLVPHSTASCFESSQLLLLQTHSRSRQCRCSLSTSDRTRRFAVKRDWLVVCKLSVYFDACCVCLCTCCVTWTAAFVGCSICLISPVLFGKLIALTGSFSDAEIKLLMLVLSRFAFLNQLWKVTILGCRQVALAYVSALHRRAHPYTHHAIRQVSVCVGRQQNTGD